MLVMQWQVLYIISMIITMFVMIMILLYALRQRYVSGTWHFIGFILPIMCWVCNVGLMALAPPETGIIWLNLKYLWIALSPVMLLLFILEYTDSAVRLKVWRVVGLFIIPIITQLIVWTNHYHHLIIRDVQFTQTGMLTYIPQITFGPYYWVHTGYSYSLSLFSMVLVIITMLRGSYLYRRQGIMLVIGILATFIGNILLIANIAPREIDPMPFALLITSLFLGWSVFRHHLLNLSPVARNVFVDTIPDSMLVIDNQGRIIDANKSMLQMIGLPQHRVIGLPVRDVLHPWHDLISEFQGKPSVETEISISARQFDLHIMPLTDRRARTHGSLVFLHDITHRKQLEEEREKLITNLQDALSEVKKLSGLLPICANCKKIRDDDGHWHRLETYIHNHSEAQFSHGICPDCIATLYPDL